MTAFKKSAECTIAKWMAVSTLLVVATPVMVQSADGAAEDTASKRQLTEQEKRGQQIYLRGTSVSERPIMATFGDAGIPVPATALLCVNCHGHDGKGVPEGGVTPSNITREALTKPYPMKHPSGRTYTAYDDRSMLKAIAMGIDPSGNRLATAMPRYQLTREEADDLIAYLNCLGKIQDAGLTETKIRLGVLLPGHDAPAGMGHAVKRVLTGYFDDINEREGIFGRQIELRFANAGLTPADAVAGATNLIQEQEVFALVNAFVEGAEAEVSSLVEAAQVPLVGAVTNCPDVGFPLNRYAFYLLSGEREMARAMVTFAATELPSDRRRMAILIPDDQRDNSLAEAIEDHCQTSNWEMVVKSVYAREQLGLQRLVAEMKEQKIEAIFYLGAGRQQGLLLAEARRQSWQPDLFIPGMLNGRDLIEATRGWAGRTYLALPRGPSDQTSRAVSSFRAFSRKHALPVQHLPAQVHAYCSAMILTETLKLAGRDVSREKLTMTLEGVYEMETGLMPLITYGPNRRIGALGAYIFRMDVDANLLTLVSGWVEP